MTPSGVLRSTPPDAEVLLDIGRVPEVMVASVPVD